MTRLARVRTEEQPPLPHARRRQQPQRQPLRPKYPQLTPDEDLSAHLRENTPPPHESSRNYSSSSRIDQLKESLSKYVPNFKNHKPKPATNNPANKKSFLAKPQESQAATGENHRSPPPTKILSLAVPAKDSGAVEGNPKTASNILKKSGLLGMFTEKKNTPEVKKKFTVSSNVASSKQTMRVSSMENKRDGYNHSLSKRKDDTLNETQDPN